jgi:cytochrome c-type biogenesis protein CcmH/NrfG
MMQPRLPCSPARRRRPASQAQFLLEAGAAYARADETARAAAAFKAAAEIEPANPRPYEYLATQVFAPRKDLAAAKRPRSVEDTLKDWHGYAGLS